MRQSEIPPAKACGHTECRRFKRHLVALDDYMLELRRQATAAHEAKCDLIKDLNREDGYAAFKSFAAFCQFLYSATLIVFPNSGEERTTFKAIRGRWIRALLSVSLTETGEVRPFRHGGTWNIDEVRRVLESVRLMRNTLLHFDERMDERFEKGIRSNPVSKKRKILSMSVPGYDDEFGERFNVHFDYKDECFVYYKRKLSFEDLNAWSLMLYGITDDVINGNAMERLLVESGGCIQHAEEIFRSEGLNFGK